MVDTIDRSITVFESNGVDKVANDFARITAAEDKLATVNVRVAETSETLSRATLNVQSRLDSQTRSLDPLSAAMKKLADVEATRNTALQQGLTLTAANDRAYQSIRTKVADLQAAVQGNKVSLEAHTAATGLNRAQMLEATHVAKSLFDQISAGTPVTRALTVEGGRIAQIFASGSGGVGGTLSAVRASVAGLLTPTALLTGGVVALGVAGAIAFKQWEEGQAKLEASLNGLGRASGLTRGALEGVAQAGAAAGDIHPSDARDLAAGFNATGRIGAGMNQNLIGLSKQYSLETGQSLAEGGQDLAKAFADPAKGADLLNEKLGTLDVGTRDLIRSQQAQLDILGAQRTLYGAVLHSVEGVTDRTWKLTQAAQAAVTVYERARDIAGESVATVVYTKTPEQQLSDLNQKIGMSGGLGHSPFLRMLGIPDSASQVGGLYADRDGLSKSIYAQDRLRRQQAGEINASALADPASDILKSVFPETDARQKIADQIDALKKVQDSADAMKALRDRASEVAPAIANLSTKLAAIGTPLSRLQEDGALAVQSAMARTGAERLAAEQEKTRVDMLRQGSDRLLLSTAAENARNLALATSTREALDNLHAVSNQSALLGLSPFDRAMKEVDQKYQDMRDRSVVGSGGTVAGSGDYAGAIKSVESSGGDYGALGPVTSSGDRAYGAYQVMGANIPSWTKDALGFSMTPSQFLANKDAQDTVFNRQFGNSLMKYGNPDDAASVWFTGRPLSQGAGARDSLGTTGSAYVDKFNAALGGSGSSNGAAAQDAGQSIERYNAAFSLLFPSIQQASLDIRSQTEAYQLQHATMGQSAAQIAQATEAQKEWNNLQAQGVTQQKLLTQFGDRGVKMWSDLTDKINANAAAAGHLAAIEDNDRKRAAGLDGLRGTSNDVIGGVAKAAVHGDSISQALTQSASRLTDNLIDKATSSLTSALLGPNGASGGGMFGDLLGGLFGNGAGSATIKASTVVVNATTALSGMGGLGGIGGSGGGFLASLFGGGSAAASGATAATADVGSDAAVLGMLYHSGGIVGRDGTPRYTSPADFIGAPRYHSGVGLSHDEVPAILQRGEAVVSRQDLADARRARGSSGGNGFAPSVSSIPAPQIHNHYAPGTSGTTSVSKGKDGSVMIKNLIINTMVNDLHGNGQFTRALTNRSGLSRVGR